MESLTYSAEKALLGALLLEPGLVPAVGYLEDSDFAAPRHGIIYSAIQDLSLGWGTADQAWNKAVASNVAHVAVEQYLDALRASCPDPFHAAAYRSMVLEAKVYRVLLGHADRLDNGIDDLNYHAWRQAQVDEPHALSTAGHAQHMGEVTRAMRSQISRFDPDTALPVLRPFPVVTDERVREEEIILAAVLGEHSQARAALRMLTEDAFTGPVRRTMFNIMAALDATDGVIDTLTVDWELTRNLPRPSQPVEVGYSARGQQGYVARLAAMDTSTAAIDRMSAALARRPAHAPNGQTMAVNGSAPNLIQPPPGLTDPSQGQTPKR